MSLFKTLQNTKLSFPLILVLDENLIFREGGLNKETASDTKTSVVLILKMN